MANSDVRTPKALIAVIAAAKMLALNYNAAEAVGYMISSPNDIIVSSGGTEYAAFPVTTIGSGLRF